MAKIFFTITGTKYYHGSEFLKKGKKVKLVKEPDNPYDSEAILVKLKGIGDIGHVANSPYTTLGDSMSAGRIYDKIGDTAVGTVKYVLPHGVICKLSKKSLVETKGHGSKKLNNTEYDGVEREVRFNSNDCLSFN